MHSRPRIFPSLFAAFVLAGVISQAASCTLDQSGLMTAVQRIPCNEDANCDDEDQCTVNTCGTNKTCEFKPVNGLAAEQKAGDCQQGFCANGKLTQNPDDTDLPDDLESCTTDTCVNGSPKHDKLPDDTPCTFGDSAGLCKAGKCTIECGPQKPCNDGNPCTEDTCDASKGSCTFAKLDGLPTPGYTPVVGDCSQQICVDGVATAIADDADLPDDKSPCTKDGCSMGMPVYTPVNLNAPCLPDGSGSCDSNGKCIECIDTTDCPPLAVDNGCHIRTCTNNKCGDMLAASGTEVPTVAGDCKQTFCDAAGNAMEQVSNTDVPEDNNPCTKNLCTNGVPSNPNEPMDTSCGGVKKCNATGQCLGCMVDADCGTSDDCKTVSCTNQQCVINYAAQGKAITVQTTGDCKTDRCNGMGGVTTVIDALDAPNDMNDCTVDSCNMQGMPSSVPAAMNAPCGTGGTGACNGFGMCLSVLGIACTDGGTCASGFCTDGVCCMDTCTGECMACNVTGAAGTCTNVPSNSDDAPLCTGTNSCDGMGTCKRDNGQACGVGMDCSSGFCADGVCCDTACGDTCKSCNLTGKAGVCTFIPNDTVDPTGAMPCNNPYRCDGTGLCKALNSVNCTTAADCLSGNCVDGYCCGNDCTQLCKACSGALTGGANGSCLPILNGNDPQMECPNGDCNGAGMCTGGGGGNQTNGTACSAAGQCASGYCIDGVCCGAGCTESCKTCNLAGQPGTCVNVPSGQGDNTGAMPCNNGHQCNGAGVCQGVNGVPCTMASQCVSGNCVDGFCCNNACNDLCKSCSMALGTASDGTCSFSKAGTDPDNECSGLTPNCGLGLCVP